MLSSYTGTHTGARKRRKGIGRGRGVGTLLKGIRVAMLGGDRREVELARGLLALGAAVHLVGLPAVTGAAADSEPEAALAGADVVIMPMSGPDAQGRVPTPLVEGVDIVFDEALLRSIGRKPLFIGVLPAYLRSAVNEYGARIVEWTAFDEIAIANSIPTAEGAVQIALEKLPVTVHGSKTAVIGFGRCGMTLARLLHAMGSEVSVVTRGAAERARVREMGMASFGFDQLSDVVTDQDVVFNTVPTVVLTAAVLERTRSDVLIIDIASHPAGTNFAAAKRLGRQALHVLGIPGKTAPVTAGRILAAHAPPLILAELQRR